MSDGSGSPKSSGGNSLTSTMLSPKQYFLLNLSKFVVELVGTTVIGIFYLTIGHSQAGMLLGFWIINLFGVAISGAHFHPGITLATMLRKNSSFGSRRLRGIIYIVAQFLGGLAAASVSKFLLNNTQGSNLAVSPTIHFDIEKNEAHYHNFSAMISEMAGTAYFVFLIMICTEKKTQFSEDKVINCFIMASSYVASRLVCGGKLVTCLYYGGMNSQDVAVRLLLEPVLLGPLLNPALAFGQMVWSLDFTYIVQYFLMPFAGSALALIFYEFVFVKTQEYLNDDGASEEGPKEFSMPDEIASPPSKKKEVGILDRDVEDEDEN